MCPLHTSPLVPAKVPTLDAQSQAGCERTVTGRDEATATREGEQPRQRAGKKSRAKPETSKKQTPKKNQLTRDDEPHTGRVGRTTRPQTGDPLKTDRRQSGESPSSGEPEGLR